MKDLFSGCAYIRTYVAVTLRDVNLRSRSECQFALTLRNWASLKHALHVDEGRSFLAMEDGEVSATGPSQCTYLVESNAEMSAESSRQLATLRKKEQRGSPP